MTNLLAGKPIPETFQARAQQTQERLKRDWNPTKTVEAGTSLTTTALLAHEYGGGVPGERQITIAYQVCSSILIIWSVVQLSM